MKTNRRKHSAKFKAQVVLAALGLTIVMPKRKPGVHACAFNILGLRQGE